MLSLLRARLSTRFINVGGVTRGLVGTGRANPGAGWTSNPLLSVEKVGGYKGKRSFSVTALSAYPTTKTITAKKPSTKAKPKSSTKSKSRGTSSATAKKKPAKKVSASKSKTAKKKKTVGTKSKSAGRTKKKAVVKKKTGRAYRIFPSHRITSLTNTDDPPVTRVEAASIKAPKRSPTALNIFVGKFIKASAEPKGNIKETSSVFTDGVKVWNSLSDFEKRVCASYFLFLFAFTGYHAIMHLTFIPIQLPHSFYLTSLQPFIDEANASRLRYEKELAAWSSRIIQDDKTFRLANKLRSSKGKERVHLPKEFRRPINGYLRWVLFCCAFFRSFGGWDVRVACVYLLGLFADESFALHIHSKP